MIEPSRYLIALACLTFLPHLLMELRGVRLLTWVRVSLAGHVLLFGLCWACLVSPVFLWLSRQQGTITWIGGAILAAVCTLGGIVAGVMCWYLISRPYLQRLKRWVTSDSRT